MSMNSKNIDKLPLLLTSSLALGVIFLVLKFLHLIPESHIVVIIVAALLLGAAVFSAVHHAEILALKVGEPLGSIILALAVTIIESGLIISQMSSGKVGAEFIGRDTIFSALIIVLNGIVGLCLVMGGAKHHEQTFKLDGAAAALSVLTTLAAISLIVPTYTISSPGPYYTAFQLGFVGVVSLALYCIFVLVQTVLHHDYFVTAQGDDHHSSKPANRTVVISSVFLPIALVVVVLLAKFLSEPINNMVAAAGLPIAFVGVIIALVVLLPEGFAAVRAARLNQLQTSLNLSLGSAIATIGLTIPVLATYSIWQNAKLALGIGPQASVMLILTVFVSSITLATGRTTILQGSVHLVIFFVFLFLSAVP
jgi:Ca2+:H+ antiporter